MGTSSSAIDLALVREGVSNLVREAAEVQRGDQVLVLSDYGLVDKELPDLIAEEIKSCGAEAQVMWSEPMSPNRTTTPKVLLAAMQAADRIIYNIPPGSIDQPVFSSVEALLDKDERPYRLTNNFNTLERIASDYARFPERKIRALYAYFEDLFHSATTWRLTTPTGTDISGQIGRVSSRQAALEASVSPYAKVFPTRVCTPIGSVNASGRIAVDHCAIPPMKIANPPIVELVEDRIVAVEGGAEAEAYRQALEANVQRWGDSANFLDSWHTGLNPLGPNIPGYLGHGSAARMHLHLGRSNTYISGGIMNHTLEIDGQKVLDNGKVNIPDPKVREIVGF